MKKKYQVRIWEKNNSRPLENVYTAETPQEVIKFFGLREPDIINFDIREVVGGSGYEEDSESMYAPVPVDTYTSCEVEAKIIAILWAFEESVKDGEDNTVGRFMELITEFFLLSREQQATIGLILLYSEILLKQTTECSFTEELCMVPAQITCVLHNQWEDLIQLRKDSENMNEHNENFAEHCAEIVAAYNGDEAMRKKYPHWESQYRQLKQLFQKQ